MTLSLAAALFMGLVLGLFGSGGSLLTLPVLIYVLGIEEKTAIVSALFIVFAIASMTLIIKQKRLLLDKQRILIFCALGIPASSIGAVLGELVLPQIQITTFLFAVFIAIALMYKKTGVTKVTRIWLYPAAISTGLLTGFVGVGGGFLVVPALVLVAKMPLRSAMHSSLAIVAINSLAGFNTYMLSPSNNLDTLPWLIIALFSTMGLLGSLGGQKMSRFISAKHLRHLFASFLAIIGLLVFFQQVPVAKAAKITQKEKTMILSGRDLVAQVRPNINEVSVAEVEQNLAHNIILIDVREPGEASQGVIPGAVNIPRGVLEMKLHEHPAVKAAESPLDELATKSIYLYCRSGARSALAAESLQRMGFKNVYSMQGGFEAWKAANLSIEQK